MDSINEQLRFAARACDTAKVALLLLDPKFDALFKDNNGMTALMHAAHSGHDACVRLLLPLSDILVKNNEEQTASELARKFGHEPLAKLMDAHAAAQIDKLALCSVIPSGAPCKNRSPRV